MVDDKSTDKTRDMAKSRKVILIENQKNSGKGHSIRNGIKKAKGEKILFSDADLSTPIKEYETLKKYSRSYDIVIASRNMAHSKILIRQPKIRILFGRIFNILVRIITGINYKDTQCGFKLFNKRVAKKLFKEQKLNGFAFDVEILYLAKKYNYKVKEVPVTWLNNKNSHIIPVTDSLKMLRDILRIRFTKY